MKYDFVLGFMFKSSTPKDLKLVVKQKRLQKREKNFKKGRLYQPIALIREKKKSVNTTVPHTSVNKCIERKYPAACATDNNFRYFFHLSKLLF